MNVLGACREENVKARGTLCGPLPSVSARRNPWVFGSNTFAAGSRRLPVGEGGLGCASGRVPIRRSAWTMLPIHPLSTVDSSRVRQRDGLTGLRPGIGVCREPSESVLVPGVAMIVAVGNLRLDRSPRYLRAEVNSPAIRQLRPVAGNGQEFNVNPPPPSRHCSPSRKERVRSSSDDHPIAGSPHQAEWAASSPASLAPSRARQTRP